MDVYVSRTREGTKEFPMHKHSDFEIAFYSNTAGVVRTPCGNYSFYPGSIVIIPPNTYHSSCSDTELNGIYLRGNFNILFHLKTPLVLRDNKYNEGRKLVDIIYNNCYGNKEYLSSLCDAFIHFLATNLEFEDEIWETVNELVDEITRRALVIDINLSEILRKSGYAEDYIRSKFKKATGKTPVVFLTDIRIKNACFLIETYGTSMPLSEVAEACGYTDYVYFSKKFKEIMGMSPKKYRDRC